MCAGGRQEPGCRAEDRAHGLDLQTPEAAPVTSAITVAPAKTASLATNVEARGYHCDLEHFPQDPVVLINSVDRHRHLRFAVP